MHTNHYVTRRALMMKAQSSPVVLAAHASLQRRGDAAFAFEQESNFWYLTGISEPEWWVIIVDAKTYLVEPNVSQTQRLFDGGIDAAEAIRLSGADEVIDRRQGIALLRDLALRHTAVRTLAPDPNTKYYGCIPNPAVKQMDRRLAKLFRDVVDCRLELARLRATKQPHEINVIERAVDLTVSAFQSVKEQLPRLRHEYEIEAEYSYAFRRSGAEGHAYDPIVAGGAHACTLHYSSNQDQLPENGLVLIDIGARIDGYAADITRTYAIGTPTDRHIAVHRVVEQAHHRIIELLRPGLSVREYHEQVDVIMKGALRELGLLIDDNDAAYRTYFPHAISHGLGIDVHDSLGRPEVFLPGMVLTVEPGVYIAEEGIGVRIEDDILITESGHRNLSAALPTSL